MTVIERATTELVAVAWLKELVGDIVATTVPSVAAATAGFVTVHGLPGRSNMYVPLRSPVVSVSCWAAAANSVRTPWNRAAGLAEAIVAGTYDHEATPRLLTLPGAYPCARVLTASVVQDPRRMVNPGTSENSVDPGSWARMDLSLQLHWIEVPA